MLKDAYTHALHTQTHTVNAQTGRGCEVEWHSSKPSSPYPCLFLPPSLSKPPNPSLPPSFSSSEEFINCLSTETLWKSGSYKGREGGRREGWVVATVVNGGYIILLGAGYVSFPSPVMRKTLILSEKREGGRVRSV